MEISRQPTISFNLSFLSFVHREIELLLAELQEISYIVTLTTMTRGRPIYLLKANRYRYRYRYRYIGIGILDIGIGIIGIGIGIGYEK